MNKIDLPNKPSELLMLAINDLQKCYNNKKFAVDTLRTFAISKKIHVVSLEGAVMAQTLGLKDKNLIPCHMSIFEGEREGLFDHETADKLHFIMYCDCSHIEGGLGWINRWDSLSEVGKILIQNFQYFLNNITPYKNCYKDEYSIKGRKERTEEKEKEFNDYKQYLMSMYYLLRTIGI